MLIRVMQDPSTLEVDTSISATLSNCCAKREKHLVAPSQAELSLSISKTNLPVATICVNTMSIS